jgi:hypothetical protein
VRKGGSEEKRIGTDGEGGGVTTVVKTVAVVTAVTMMADAFHLRTNMAAVATASVNGSVVEPVVVIAVVVAIVMSIVTPASSGGGSRQ